MPEVQTEKLFCNSCSRVTNHFLKATHRVPPGEPNFDITEEVIYSLWICAGCESATLDAASPWGFDPSNNQIVYKHTYSPKRRFAELSPKRFVKLSPKLSRIYTEAIKCYNDGSLLLCAVGLRALLEGICEDKHIAGENLSEKIDGLEKLVPNENIIRALHHFRFTGNQAVHKLESPEAGNAELALQVMEDLLNFLYEWDYKASILRRRVRSSRRRKHRQRLSEVKHTD